MPGRLYVSRCIKRQVRDVLKYCPLIIIPAVAVLLSKICNGSSNGKTSNNKGCKTCQEPSTSKLPRFCPGSAQVKSNKVGPIFIPSDILEVLGRSKQMARGADKLQVRDGGATRGISRVNLLSQISTDRHTSTVQRFRYHLYYQTICTSVSADNTDEESKPCRSSSHSPRLLHVLYMYVLHNLRGRRNLTLSTVLSIPNRQTGK